MAKEATTSEDEVVKLEQAVSDRSTCRATGEKIQKGEWRVGIMAWRSGRNTMTWQKSLPFLKNCLFETCEKANSGTCKLTGHKFAKGEARFVCSTGDKRVFLTIPAAAQLIQPVIDAESNNFSASDFKGLESIEEADQKEVAKQFGISKSAIAAKKEEDAAVVKNEPDEGKENKKKPSKKRGTAGADAKPAKRQRRGKNAAKKEEWEEEEEEDEEAEEEDLDMEEAEEEEEEEAEAEAEGAEEEEIKEEEEGDESEEDIPDYEKQRQAIIARNQARMRELGLKELAAEIMPVAKPKPRPSKGISAKKKAAPEGPRRTSLRQRGVAADGQMISEERRNGAVIVTMPSGAPQKSTSAQPTEPQQPQERHPKGEIAFDSGNEDKGLDECFLELLRGSLGSSIADTKSKSSGTTSLHKLQLREEDVAKVTDNGISHIQWHPSSDTPVVAAADKSGNVGLWSIDHPSDSPGDGVVSFKPHNSYVSGLRWAGAGKAPVKLFSCSYDGSIRLLDATAGRFELAVSTEEAEFSAFDCSPDGNVAIAGDNDGCVRVYDVRDNRGTVRAKPTEIHNRRVNTLQFSYGDEHVFLSSAADNSLAVWDMRKLNGGTCKAIAKTAHPKTCQSAYFAPDGSDRVVSLSRDDTIKVWQFDRKSKLNPVASIHHYNNTGRWILPFRATWSPSADAIIVGNMKRQVDIYSPEGNLVGKLQSEHMTAISSRAAVHPDGDLLAAATASGRIHVFR